MNIRKSMNKCIALVLTFLIVASNANYAAASNPGGGNNTTPSSQGSTSSVTDSVYGNSVTNAVYGSPGTYLIGLKARSIRIHSSARRN
jgi:hypothetical protein